MHCRFHGDGSFAGSSSDPNPEIMFPFPLAPPDTVSLMALKLRLRLQTGFTNCDFRSSRTFRSLSANHERKAAELRGSVHLRALIDRLCFSSWHDHTCLKTSRREKRKVGKYFAHKPERLPAGSQTLRDPTLRFQNQKKILQSVLSSNMSACKPVSFDSAHDRRSLAAARRSNVASHFGLRGFSAYLQSSPSLDVQLIPSVR